MCIRNGRGKAKSIGLNVSVIRAGESSDVAINLTSPALFQAAGLRAKRQDLIILMQTGKEVKNECTRNNIEGETCILLRITSLDAGGY